MKAYLVTIESIVLAETESQAKQNAQMNMNIVSEKAEDLVKNIKGEKNVK